MPAAQENKQFYAIETWKYSHFPNSIIVQELIYLYYKNTISSTALSSS